MELVPVDTKHIHRVQIGLAAFLLRTFSALEWARLRAATRAFTDARHALGKVRSVPDSEANAEQIEDAALAVAEASLPLLREGLIGWEDWSEAFTASEGRPTESALRTLPVPILDTLAIELYAHNSASVFGLGKLKSRSVYPSVSSAETRTRPSSDAPDAGEAAAAPVEAAAS